MDTATKTNGVLCPICSFWICLKEPASFFSHIKWTHSLSTSFFVTCKFPGCDQQYHKYESFRRHWNKAHGSSLPNKQSNVNDKVAQKSMQSMADNGPAKNVSINNGISQQKPIEKRHLVYSNSCEKNQQSHTEEAIENFDCVPQSQLLVALEKHSASVPQSQLQDAVDKNSACVPQSQLQEPVESSSACVPQSQLQEPVERGLACGPQSQLGQSELPQKGKNPTPETVNSVWTPPMELNEREWEAGVLLMLRQKHFLPFDALMVVSTAMHDFYERRISTIQEKLVAVIANAKTTNSLEFKCAFTQLQQEEELTRSRLETTWSKVFPTVMPESVILNESDPSYDWKNDPEIGLILDEVFEMGYIIPFLKSLKQFLSIKAVYDAVLVNFKQNSSESSEVYSDVWDGKFVKRDTAYIELGGAILCFQIYMDEVELANPLGSKKGKHKVSVFYWVLMNLPPRFRSCLRSIQLLGIVSCDLLKHRGVDVFLRPFLVDLILLRKGVSLTIRNDTRQWHGMLLNFAGDIPASNFVGGFKEGAGFANLPCRSCMIHRDDLETIHHESACVMRDKNSHQLQVAQIENKEETQAGREALSKKFGINRKCCFTVLDYFDPTKCFMHDLMHVSFEGILNLGIALLLNNLMLDPTIQLDLDDVNYSISTMKSDREWTVPPPIRKNEVLELSKLSFSSSEMSSLAICLGIVLGDYVNSDENPYFAQFLLLLEIMASLQCYSFTENDLVVLESNIERHNRNHVLLYPKASGSAITPKLHSLIHFPNQIRQFGPPRYAWCFRYESQNAPFKKIMRRNCNFHNVPWSLSTHHQKLVGLNIRTDGEGDFFGMKDDIKMICSSTDSRPTLLKHSRWATLLSEKYQLKQDSEIRHLTKIKISGRICSLGTVFLRHFPVFDEGVQFFRVSDILVLFERVFFIMECMETCFFGADRFGFVVIPKKKFSVISSIDLKYDAPLHSFLYKNNLYVIPNYYQLL